ncbi:alpha,alpha-trehalose-phosphate synthase (UDP-forming) [Branchiibius cervicis]|uniref:Trehalose-6-phosphate synthase n=1 Tax=Branchiibius cervicis TaxID=908252 RepID=A0ABW2AW85_9MICO
MTSPTFDLVIAANRLPVDKEVAEDGSIEWHRSPGGLVTAMESVMRGREAAWIGWSGDAGDPPEPFEENGMYLVPIGLSEDEVTNYYEGYSNDTLWPLYHDVIVPATFRRRWRSSYERINQRFAEAVSEVAAPGATVWLHDYQLQRVPSLLRAIRPDLRIGWFNHIPFPPVEIFMQLPGRETLLEGLLGADFLGFQVRSDAANFREACRRLLHSTVRGRSSPLPTAAGCGRRRCPSRSTSRSCGRWPLRRRRCNGPRRSAPRWAIRTS